VEFNKRLHGNMQYI